MPFLLQKREKKGDLLENRQGVILSTLSYFVAPVCGYSYDLTSVGGVDDPSYRHAVDSGIAERNGQRKSLEVLPVGGKTVNKTVLGYGYADKCHSDVTEVADAVAVIVGTAAETSFTYIAQMIGVAVVTFGESCFANVTQVVAVKISTFG